MTKKNTRSSQLLGILFTFIWCRTTNYDTSTEVPAGLEKLVEKLEISIGPFINISHFLCYLRVVLPNLLMAHLHNLCYVMSMMLWTFIVIFVWIDFKHFTITVMIRSSY